ncbi:hypothetical protein BH11ACT4_BH11ACT4_21990 [soil metagenome]
MATSSGSFWRSAVGRWLGSTKNILGSVLAVGAIAAQLVFGLGPLWPLVIVASYGVGALVAPRDRVDLRLGLGAGASAEELQAQLKVFRRAMKGEASRLTDDANAILAKILDALDEIVARWDDLASAPDQRHVVEQMIIDYLPTSIQKFLNLPRTFALTSRVAGQKSAHDELIEQLTILEKESDRIRTALYSRDLDALGDQGRFLREKFGKSDLQL